MAERKKSDVDVPSTLERSEQHAQDTYAEALVAAEDEYDDEARAHRTAWSAVKHAYEKVGDHWEPKPDGARGPSDAQSEKSGAAAREPAQPGESRGGVDENASKEHLLDLAKAADVAGRSSMTKAELADALQHANDRATRESRADQE